MSTARRRPRATPATAVPRAPAVDREVLENLALEFFTSSWLTLRELGLSTAGLDRTVRRARGLARAPRVSGPLLQDTRGLGALLLEWSREPGYLTSTGKPRVLSIRGPGATFETLARRHLPKMALNRVVKMACQRAEVTKHAAGQIALVGGVLVKFPAGDDTLTLANTVRHIDQLLTTVLHNRRLQGRSPERKRLERRVVSVIDPREYPDFMEEFRPQIYELMSRMDASLTRRQPTSPRALKNAAAVSVGVFVSVDEDLKRAGVDAMQLMRPARRGKEP